MVLILIEFFYMEVFCGANAFVGLVCTRGVACDSSCGHMVCNQSRWELMVHKWDQLKSASAFHSRFISLSVSPALQLSFHSTPTSRCYRHQQSKDSKNVGSLSRLFAHGLVQAASSGGHSSHFHPRLHCNTGRQEVEAQSGAAPV